MSRAAVRAPAAERTNARAPRTNAPAERSGTRASAVALDRQREPAGEAAVSALSTAGTSPNGFRVHPKLALGTARDPAEVEADRVGAALVGRRPAADAAVRPRPANATEGIPVPAETEGLVRAATSGGRPLPGTLRADFQARSGRDLRDVRVRDDAVAGMAARALNARGFALGQQIAFAPGEYRPETAAGSELVAHEVAHTMQARVAGEPSGETASMVRREEPGVFDRIGGAIGGAADALVDQALRILPDDVERVLRRIKERGFLGYLGDMIRAGLSSIFSTISDTSPALGRAMLILSTIGTRIAAILGALASGDCEPLFAALRAIQTVVGDVAGGVWEEVVAFLRPIGDFFGGLWNDFGKPAWESLKALAGDAWEEITGLASWLWQQTAPLRGGIADLWGAVCEFLGISEAGEGSNGGLLEWIKDQARRAWEGIKSLAEPVLAPMRRVVDQVADFLPLQAIANLRATLTTWLAQMGANVDALGDADTTGSAAGQATLRNTLLPALANVIVALKGGLESAGLWITSTIGGLATSITGLVTTISANSLLGAFARGLSWLRDAASTATSFATTTVQGAVGFVQDGLDLVHRFVRRMLGALIAVAETVADLAGRFSGLVLGPLWRLIPRCIRDPLVDFITDQILARIPLFSQLVAIPNIWSRLVSTALSIIRSLFVDGNLARGLWRFFSAMLELIGLPPDLVLSILTKALAVAGDILRNPVSFLLNLLAALRDGFAAFMSNALSHLFNGVSGWLFAQASRAGLTPPADLGLGEIFRFVVDVLGLGIDFVVARLARISQPVADMVRRGVAIAEQGLEWLTALATDGPVALWRWLRAELGGLWNTMLTTVAQWVNVQVVTTVIRRLLTSLEPTGIGAVVNGIITLYRAIQSAVEYLEPMLRIAKSVLDGIAQIARGVIAGAAAFVEGAMARSVPIVVGFLANQVGLGTLGERLRETVSSLRERIAAAVDALFERGRALIARIGATVSNAVGAVRAWWNQRRNVDLGDGERHTLSFERRGNRTSLMLASEEKPVLQHLDEAIGDPELDGDARDAAVAARAYYIEHLHPLTIGPQPDPLPAEQQVLADNLPTTLNRFTEMLRAIGEAASLRLPRASDVTWDYAGPAYASVEQLSNRTSRGGQDANRGDPAGWAQIQAGGLSVRNQGRWVRMHMLSAGFGGRDVAGNLLPAPSAVNTGSNVRGFETGVEDLLYGERSAGDVRRASRLFSSLRSRVPVIWVRCESSGFWPAYTHPSDPRLSYGGGVFARAARFSAGLHVPRDGRWDRDPAALLQVSVTIEKPDFSTVYAPNINNVGAGTFVQLTETTRRFADLVVAERGGTPARRPFSDATDFALRMDDALADATGRPTVANERHIASVVSAAATGRFSWS